MSNQQESHQLTRQGITTFKAGDKLAAATLFHKATQLDPDNQTAWLWLSGCVESYEARAKYLEKVIAINGENEAAKRARMGLERLKEAELPEVDEIIPAKAQTSSVPIQSTPPAQNIPVPIQTRQQAVATAPISQQIPTTHADSIGRQDKPGNILANVFLIGVVASGGVFLLATGSIPLEYSGLVLFWLLCGFIAAPMHHGKGKSAFGGFIVGFLLGPLGILLIALSKPKGAEHQKSGGGGILKAFVNIIAFIVIVIILFNFLAILF